MKSQAVTIAVLLLMACGSNNTGGALDAAPADGAVVDSGGPCFPCNGYWICGGDVTRVDLQPEVDGCYLSGLPGRNLLAPDGTITVDGAVVGRAVGSGARVHVSYPDGGQWLFCAGAGGCR